MKFYVMTLFPQMILDGLNTSITGRAIESGALCVEAVDIRDFSQNKHMKVDDYPYGGGAGMVMQAGPVCDAYESIAAGCKKRPRVVYMTPQGHTFNQSMAEEFAKEIEAQYPAAGEVYPAPLSLSIACHIGPGSLAIAMSKKIDIGAERKRYGL